MMVLMFKNPLAYTLVSGLLCGSIARAQAIEFERSYVGMQGGVGAEDFGYAVCLRGARLMVAAPAASTVAPGAGEVQWFQYANPPIFMSALHGSDIAAGDAFGAAIALDGDRLVVGAPNHVHAGQAAGAAYVLAWSGTAWVEEAELLPPDGAAGDGFGAAIDVSGSTIVVGASHKDAALNPDQGAAYVFERVAGAWAFAQKLGTPDAGVNEGFGFATAVDGDRIAVASFYGNGGYPPGNGAIFLFHRTGATWTQDGRLVQPPAGGDHPEFGFALDLAGDLVAVGHPYGGSTTGFVHLFRQSAGTWSLEASLAPLYGYSLGGQLGRSLEMLDDHLVAGSIWYSPYGFFSGGAYVFEREAATWGSWSQTVILVPSANGSGSSFGRAVSYDGQHVAVGASGASPYAFTYDTVNRVGVEYCFGDGSGASCPCGNTSLVGAEAGCRNDGFAAHGAALAALGSTSVAADDLVFSVLGTGPNHPPMLLFAGTTRVNTGLGGAFGDGLRCAGGAALRLGQRTGASNFGLAAWGPGLVTTVGWSAGQTRYFQCFYRSTSGPCASGFNLTNGLEVTFTP